MKLILARHGNTFDPGQKVVWAGATNDLPLVAKGKEQARGLARTFLDQNLKPKAIYTSKLSRARETAEIITREMSLPFAPTVDHRLHEIDYGDWTGRSTEETIALYGREAVEAWEKRSTWPTSSHWGGTEEQVIEETWAFSKDLLARHTEDDCVVAVTSNGRLRYFLTLIKGEWEKRKALGAFKVRTGHYCELTHSSGRWSLDLWDQGP